VARQPSLEALKKKGYTRVLMQVSPQTPEITRLIKDSHQDVPCGGEPIEPCHFLILFQVGAGSQPGASTVEGLEVKWYNYKDSLREDMEGAALVISHAGMCMK
jgi:UDP-N-acetylglucosamine transferase subunit ALG13